MQLKKEISDINTEMSRSVPLTDTLKKIRSIKPEIGITRVADLTDFDQLGVYVYSCIRPLSKTLSLSLGKGMTREAAEISAIMEAVELYCGENCREAYIQGTFNELKYQVPVIDPILFEQGFIRVNDIHTVKLDWIEGHDLLNLDEKVLLPRALFCLDATINYNQRSLFNTSTNGLATGNNREEAFCHAIYEIIERDCLSQFSMLIERNKFPKIVDLTSIKNSHIQEVILKLKKAHFDLLMFDITSNIGVPTFQCVIMKYDQSQGVYIYNGSCCHLNSGLAILKALAEAIQSRLAIISGARDDIYIDRYQKNNTTLNKSQIEEIERHSERTVENPNSFNLTSHEQLAIMLDKIKNEGYQNIYYVTHENSWNIPVMHAVIPGMKFSVKRA